MSYLPEAQSINHPATGELVFYNCVLAVDGRSTLCLIDQHGVRWGELWLDELPEDQAQQVLSLHWNQATLPETSTFKTWLLTVGIWAVGVGVLVGIWAYF